MGTSQQCGPRVEKHLGFGNMSFENRHLNLSCCGSGKCSKFLLFLLLLTNHSSMLIANRIDKTQVKISKNNPLTQSASFSVLSFSFFLLQLPLLPLWLSFQFTFGWVPMPLNRLHPASFLCVCLLHSEPRGEKNKFHPLLSSDRHCP